MTGAPGADFDAGSFAAEFQQFLSEFRRLISSDPAGPGARVGDHLGVDPGPLPSIAEKLEPNEMDGMAADADVIFVLTTNRAELLEPALASRPGRIDQVVEMRLPDGDQRRRLFELYLRKVPHRLDNLASLVSATEGVSPAFIKEVIRRAIVEATPAGAPETPGVVDEHLNRALADLLTRSDPLTRAILGAGGIRPGESTA
jgi:hypothetical protein